MAKLEGVEVWDGVVQHQYHWVDRVSVGDMGRGHKNAFLSILTSLTSLEIKPCLPTGEWMLIPLSHPEKLILKENFHANSTLEYPDAASHQMLAKKTTLKVKL